MSTTINCTLFTILLIISFPYVHLLFSFAKYTKHYKKMKRIINSGPPSCEKKNKRFVSRDNIVLYIIRNS